MMVVVQSFMNAWEQACKIDGGVVTVPRGTFLLSSADFKGPCIGRTLFKLEGTLVANGQPLLDDQDYWITFYKVERVTISGDGVFDGNGASSWSVCHGKSKCNDLPPTVSINNLNFSYYIYTSDEPAALKPRKFLIHHFYLINNNIYIFSTLIDQTIKINYANFTRINGVKFINSKFFHVHIHESENVLVQNVHIIAPADSPNTDGIHVGNSDRVTIRNSNIATGDDCISLGEGSTNINITGIWCGPGHGISIGSLGKIEGEENVSGITVRNSTLTKTQNGLRIKTWAPSASSNLVSGVTFVDIITDQVENPIIIDQYYCPHSSCEGAGESSVQIQGVRFLNVKGTSASEAAVDIKCSRKKPCKDIEFSGIHLTYGGGAAAAFCDNADQKFIEAGQVPSRCS